jgi:hypothetical protein
MTNAIITNKWKDQFICCRKFYKQVILIAFLQFTISELKWKWIIESPKLKMDLYTPFPRQPLVMKYLIILHPSFIAIDVREHYLKATDQYYHNLLKFYLWLLTFENTSLVTRFHNCFIYFSVHSVLRIFMTHFRKCLHKYNSSLKTNALSS